MALISAGVGRDKARLSLEKLDSGNIYLIFSKLVSASLELGLSAEFSKRRHWAPMPRSLRCQYAVAC